MTSASRHVGDRDAGAAYYETNYPDYARQNSRAKLEFYLDLLRKRVPRGSRVFELGVGLGSFFELAAREYDCRGCDVNAFGVEATRARVPGARLTIGSSEAIPVEEPPQAVVAWDVLEHVPDIQDALRTIHARLSPGGFLIAVVPLYDGPLGWLVQLLDHDETHVSKWGRRRWLDTLAGHGFEVVEWGGIVRRLVGRVYVHVTKPQFLLRSTGSAMYFVARKPGGSRS